MLEVQSENRGRNIKVTYVALMKTYFPMTKK